MLAILPMILLIPLMPFLFPLFVLEMIFLQPLELIRLIHEQLSIAGAGIKHLVDILCNYFNMFM